MVPIRHPGTGEMSEMSKIPAENGYLFFCLPFYFTIGTGLTVQRVTVALFSAAAPPPPGSKFVSVPSNFIGSISALVKFTGRG